MLHSIEICSLTKRYGKLYALNDVSLQFKAGKIYLLLGHNGAGKTTLMKLLLGIMKLKKNRCRTDSLL
jgi:ABC-type multidrug transport system ATPase subunit